MSKSSLMLMLLWSGTMLIVAATTPPAEHTDVPQVTTPFAADMPMYGPAQRAENTGAIDPNFCRPIRLPNSDEMVQPVPKRMKNAPNIPGVGPQWVCELPDLPPTNEQSASSPPAQEASTSSRPTGTSSTSTSHSTTTPSITTHQPAPPSLATTSQPNPTPSITTNQPTTASLVTTSQPTTTPTTLITTPDPTTTTSMTTHQLTTTSLIKTSKPTTSQATTTESSTSQSTTTKEPATTLSPITTTQTTTRPMSTLTPRVKPQAHYSFEGNVEDVSGGSHHGSVIGSTYGTIGYVVAAGICGQAVSFSGDAKVTVDSFKNYQWGTAFSVSVWFKRTGELGNYQGIVNNGYSTNGGWEIRMGRENDGQMLGGGVFTDDVGKWDYQDLIAETNAWHHVAMTYDGVALLYYFDGVRQPEQNPDCCVGPIITRDTPVTIGQAGVGKTDQYFYGLIDEVKIYDTTISESEVKKLYETPCL